MTADFSAIAPGDRVICAVSGGADSMALLWLLHTRAQALGITVEAAHFNHRLRGEEANRDERFVRDFCAAHAISLHLGSGDVLARSRVYGESIEQAARELRYAFLFGLPADKIAVAHNANDHLETMLLHLLRGTGLRGLCGIPPVRGKIVRPLLTVSREQILAYLAAQQIPYCEDSTNLEPGCLRNRLRQRVVPLLLQENPRLLEKAAQTAEYLRQDEAFLSGLARELLEKAALDEGRVSCASLLSAPPPVRGRAIESLLRQWGVSEPNAAHRAAIEHLLSAQAASGQAQLPGVTVCRAYDVLFAEEKQPPLPETPLKVPGETYIASAGLLVRCEFVKKNDFFENSTTTFTVKYDMIGQSIIRLRPRRTGDQMSVGCGQRSLKRLFIDRKIPRWEREQVPVLADDDGVLAVYGIGVNVLRRAEQSECALKITIEKQKKEAIGYGP